MHWLEKVLLTLLGDFGAPAVSWRPHNDSAPRELCPLDTPLMRSGWKALRNSVLSFPTSAPTLSEWPWQEQRRSGLTASASLSHVCHCSGVKRSPSTGISVFLSMARHWVNRQDGLRATASTSTAQAWSKFPASPSRRHQNPIKKGVSRHSFVVARSRIWVSSSPLYCKIYVLRNGN